MSNFHSPFNENQYLQQQLQHQMPQQPQQPNGLQQAPPQERLNFFWEPKEDITIHELAVAVEYLIGAPLYKQHLNQPFARHFKIL